MYYIKSQPNESGNYGNPVSVQHPGAVALPEELLSAYIEARGFVIPTIENGTVTSLEVNQTALDSYLAEHPDTPDYKAQIVELKEALSATDYKIIKCSEAQLLGEELPYDIAALHAERQAIRDQINELEASQEVN